MFRLGSKVYSILYFARAIAANIGIIASSFILPHYGWFGCFAFFGILTILSFLLLLVFNEKPLPVKTSIKEKKAGPTGTPYSPDTYRRKVGPIEGDEDDSKPLPEFGKSIIGDVTNAEENWNMGSDNSSKKSKK